MGDDYSPVLIDLSPLMIRKLGDNKVVQLKGGMIGGGMKVMVPPHMAKRLSRAQRLNKGMRFHMTPEDLEMNGGRINWKKLGRTIKKGAKKAWEGYKKYVKPVVGPAVRKGLTKGAQALVAANPELGFLEPVVAPAVAKVGDISGAYGMKKKRAAPKKKSVSGGSFLATGSYRGGGAGARTILERGTPANVLAGPALPAPLVHGVSPAMYPVIDYGSPQFGSDYIPSYGRMMRGGSFMI